MRMSELLNEVNRFELDEGFSPREIKMAIGIASDPRYAKGNMTGAVKAIEKMKKGLSKHPQVAAVLKRQNENLDEAKFQVNYSKGGKLFSKIVNAKDEDDAESKAIKQFKIEDDDIRSVVKEGFASDAQRRAAFASGYKEKGKKKKEEVNEDGHTDVASAVRQCKTMVEDATQIMSKLQTMSPEESLPSWWTNKLAIASNNMNKLRDYFLVPSNVTEELQEAMGDLEDMKKIVAELEKASKMHLGQSKRVQAHVDMMSKMEETELGEEISINELKMNDPKLLKVFDKQIRHKN